MRIFVTGAGGFVGGYIADVLTEAGHEVVGTVFHNPSNGVYRIVSCNLSNPIDINESFDVIVHAAGSLPHKESRYTTFKRNNVDSMVNLIEFAQRVNVKKFVYLSTIGVYGDFRDSYITEESDRINPDAYGNTKYMAECLLRDSGIQNISLRMPGIIGKGSKGVWFSNTMEKFRRNEPVTIYSSEFRTRNFVWVEDLAHFVEDLIEMESWKYDVLNIACHERVAIGELVQYIKALTGSDSEICVKDGARVPFCLDDSRAVEMGYRSIAPFEMVSCYLRSLRQYD